MSVYKLLTVFVGCLVSTVSSLVAAGGTFIKQCIKRVQGGTKVRVECHCENWVKGKVVVITGANSGIGYATAQDLSRKGARVYLGCRHNQRGSSAAKTLRDHTGNQNIHYLNLDLADFLSVHRFVSSISERESHVDALVNNAGVFHHPAALTKDGLELTYQTNYLGVLLLTFLLLRVVQCSPDPRVVFVSSEAHRLVSVGDLVDLDPRQVRPLNTFQDHVNNYGLSKLALHLLAQHLIDTNQGVSVVLTDPGNVWTGIYRHSWQAWSEILTRLRCYTFMRGSQEGAQSTIHALNSPTVQVNGKYISSFLVAEKERTYDRALVRQFISASKELVGLQSDQD